MIKPIVIIAGEPNSISSEIIFKSWKKRKKYIRNPIIIIGSIDLINLQKKKLDYSIKTKLLKINFNYKKLKKNILYVYDIKYVQKRPFQKVSIKSNNYIFKCFEVALKLIKDKRISGFINCPVSKETLFKNKHQGITEFLSKKAGVQGNEVMLIYNKKLSVAPITTHIPLKKVSSKINKLIILKKIKIINDFYRKRFKRKPKIGVLGLNPHNFSSLYRSEEKEIIKPAIKLAKKNRLKVRGPLPPDAGFLYAQKNKLDTLVGMYHDQVLSPFKTLFKYNAINITLGLPYIRISPDHGIGLNIVGKKKANPQSLIESIKFLQKIK